MKIIKIIGLIFVIFIVAFIVWLKFDWGDFWAIDKCLDAGRVWDYEQHICK